VAASRPFLEKEQCSEVQGYFLGRPAQIDAFHAITHGGSAKAAQAELPFKRAVGA
jgi:EAL domain-containing protein (putative c-di-GMP-specific phosphodiesterase class I)